LYFLSGDTILAADIRADVDRPVGTARPLFSIEAAKVTERRYAVTPDGRRCLMVVPLEEAPCRSRSP